jgi:hypothetical protein
LSVVRWQKKVILKAEGIAVLVTACLSNDVFTKANVLSRRNGRQPPRFAAPFAIIKLEVFDERQCLTVPSTI